MKSKRNKRNKKNKKTKRKIYKKKQLGGEVIKILVYCHGYKLLYIPENPDNEKFIYDDNGIITTYKLSTTLELLLSTHGWTDKQIIIDTIDIIGDPTYKRDGFDPSFIDEHIEEYDLVYVPDCNGKWVHLQNDVYHDKWDTGTQSLINAYKKMNASSDVIDKIMKERSNKAPKKDLNELMMLIQMIGKMVKPNGILFCSKFQLSDNEHDIPYMMDNMILNGFMNKSFSMYSDPSTSSLPNEQLDSYTRPMYIYAIKEE